ncbi:L-serine dehydratase [Actinoplanes lutulentus]|uniref:L-serine dehydratase n=1 Tax=Actinoplanes lutulentus TaxID=1287878 RepID=A0A327Z9U3_9ACTN|nr:L-serine ammonia-lyase [Actinoplanes lutulentus]MBB2948426.1 L-serine dehydratase [Actinoplanes lutulentus]RAK34541.1 L-serine ammonia-lyase [Actinoplanes lutulentus]
MAVSVFDLFSIGIGPSSSHTVGPMRAAHLFAGRLASVDGVTTVRAELFGSLGATGHGHGTPKAVLLGLQGFEPETVDVTLNPSSDGLLTLPHGAEAAVEMVLHRRRSLPEHPNGMVFTALGADGAELLTKRYFSVGGGFVVGDLFSSVRGSAPDLPHPFSTGDQLLALTRSTGLSISRLMLDNESVRRPAASVNDGLLHIWSVMSACIDAGLDAEGVLPGGLKVRRRAASTARQLRAAGDPATLSMEWLTAYAMAVNEQNAAGGRVVTAPTNGAAGIIPAVLRYYLDFVPGASDAGIVRFLLAAGAIGLLFKENASISGAEVGCQGEVGSACAMAAAGLAEVLGGTPEQVENAAEIGMEHNLGLTCDPVGGLVQIPCIERNGMGAVKAVTAARMALRGDGRHHVSLDKVIKTMKETGADMKVKYKETARGGLAVNVIEC